MERLIIKKSVFLICLWCVFTLVGQLKAYSIAQPQRKEIISKNGEFCIVTDPITDLNKIHRTSDPAIVLWEFQLEIWDFPVIVSNDGQTVAVVGSRYIGEKALKYSDCIIFFTSDGNSIGIPLSEVYPDPPSTKYWGGGPMEGSWRKWYNHIKMQDDQFTIHTTGGGFATFDLNQRQLVTKKFVGIYNPKNVVITILILIILICWRIYRRRKILNVCIKKSFCTF